MNKVQEKLIQRISSKEAKVGVYGLGYVGLPLAMRFSEAGFPVTGFDVDEEKIETLKKGKSYFTHYGDSAVAEALATGFDATSDYALTSGMDVVILCLPTPLDEHNQPDLSYVLDTLRAMGPHLREGQVVSLESTTYPGTTREELVPIIEGFGHAVGSDIFVVYSPEREDPGNASYKTRTIPKLVGGITEACLNVGIAPYEEVIDEVVPVRSTEIAEMSKLLENVHRAVNIGLINEMKIVADRMGIDIFEVIDAAATKPFGFVPYFPGPGWTLHSHRPLLPYLESQRVWCEYPLY